MFRALAALAIAGCQFTARAPGGADVMADAAAGDGALLHDAQVDGRIVADAPRDSPPPPPPALVQQQTASANNTNAPLTATFVAAPAAGHLLVVVGAAEHGGLAGVTGGGVTTWTRATRSLQNTNIEIWYGVADGSSSAVTISFPAYTLPIWMNVSEWSGLVTSNVLDKTLSTAGTASPAGAGSVTTTSPHELVIFGVGDQSPNTFGAPAGPWNGMTNVTSNATSQSTWYQVVSSAGTFAPTVSETHHSWDAAIATFRAP